MIVDSSALVAIVRAEPGHEALVERLGSASRPAVGAPTLVETGLVLESRLGPAGRSLLARLLTDTSVSTIPFGAEHARIAVDAFTRFGKGRHPAGLNYGDCMTYATAKVAKEPLLALGADFAATDVELA